MEDRYLAATVAAAFWAGRFEPVDPLGAMRLGFRLADGDVALGATDPDAGWWAVLLLGRGHILAITPEGTAAKVGLDGVLLGVDRHRVVAAVSAGSYALAVEAVQ